MSLRVLGLTTTAWASFYETQERAADHAGVAYTTLEVAGDHRAFDDGITTRSPIDYARFYPRMLYHSRQGYDLLHANYGLTAPMAVAQPWLPVVVSLWGGEFLGNRFAPLIRESIKRADAVVVPSRAMLDRLPGKLRPRAEVLPFPVDTDQFRPRSQTTAREAVGWDTDERIVLFPYAKGRYEKHYPLAERVLDGLDGVTLRTVANEPYDRMPNYLNASDALLVTSRWESGPMAVKEALACNLPVVSRPVGFVPDLLEDLDGTHIAGTVRGLRRGLESALERDAPIEGRDRVLDNDEETMGRRLRAIYERVLDGEMERDGGDPPLASN